MRADGWRGGGDGGEEGMGKERGGGREEGVRGEGNFANFLSVPSTRSPSISFL